MNFWNATGTPVYLESHSSAIVALAWSTNRCAGRSYVRAPERGAPVFKIRQSAGCASNLMIDSIARGKPLVECPGDESVVLMRGHGSTVVGPTVSRAVYRSI
ncbi:class II aldolase/adducin family protein [Paraburkholderia sp. BL25I1N1]|uniref:class II aldolase/adducin family protein n=1 Tax=Paraburkholderia sp. BL25I1N1 TaxID=1938804 RepID=UPI0015E5E7BF